MDSLLASYASSDEEEHEEQLPPPPQRIPPANPAKSVSVAGEEKDEDFLPKSTPKRGGIFDSLPPPKSSLFNSLPPPKSQSVPNPKPQPEIERQRDVGEQNVENPKPKLTSSSLFSSLPAPKSSSSSSSSASKRVVQFKPPTITNPHSGSFDDEDEDEEEEERQRKRSKESISTTSATSFLSSIPAPKYSATLGALPSASGKSRRSMVETAASASDVSTVNATGIDASANPNVGYSNDQSNDTNYPYSSWSSETESNAYYSGNSAAPNATRTDAGVNSDVRHLGDQSHESYDHSNSLGGESYGFYGAYGAASIDGSSVSTPNTGSYEGVDYSYAHGQHVEYTNYGGSYGDYGNNAQYENNWANSSTLPEASGVVENAFPVAGKRGRKDVPAQIVEVKQDDLTKNRPREDQVKSTGIAFGPAYQPTSTKGKPTKLHKRKHQIGSLYFDMRQKEMELAERRSKGFLTKAQTQAKYGW